MDSNYHILNSSVVKHQSVGYLMLTENCDGDKSKLWLHVGTRKYERKREVVAMTFADPAPFKSQNILYISGRPHRRASAKDDLHPMRKHDLAYYLYSSESLQKLQVSVLTVWEKPG
ncbi:hypothetical protein CEXT_81351 [Caerostris extrusa]|uniref:Uncharacterized protein n=1 Tax=Caerostris extrusa TaxID=172846 RepID=A0AAV4P6N8_CAEEX|nr:hypothetical protein CEXT_81351 [Caerostris extrusa]